MIEEVVRLKARNVFKQLHKNLPGNTNSVYIEVQLRSGCLVYIPTNSSNKEALDNEKAQWEHLTTLADF